MPPYKKIKPVFTKGKAGSAERQREVAEFIRQNAVSPDTTHQWTWVEQYGQPGNARSAICEDCGLTLVVIAERQRGAKPRGIAYRTVYGGNENGIGGLVVEPRCPGPLRRRR